MISLDPLKIESYDYALHRELIASVPAEPKDSCRLLIYNRKNDTIIHERFYNILKYIPSSVAIVLNDTKVIKARIFGNKQSGGKVELLLNSPLGKNQFLVYIRGKVIIDSKLYFDNELTAKVNALNIDGTRVVTFYKKEKILNFLELNEILNIIGHTPLPPYIKRADSKDDEKNYQTLFAKNIGAVAAPTASLHFSEKLFSELKRKKETHYLTLHVGAGTFKPVETKKISEHKMHSEFYQIPQDTVDLIYSKKEILAVGTTVTRAIEYFLKSNNSLSYADIFIHPKNPPQRVNYLLTNFHLPKSTLLMLVSAFIGVEKTLEIYDIAIKNKYRFFSYGDAMLIL